MKKIILILTFGVIGMYGFSQVLKDDQVPRVVKEKVFFTFPSAVDLPISWTKVKREYKANLIIMDAPAMIVVDSLGKIKRIERRITDTYLPQKAKSYLKSLDSNYQVVRVIKITDENDKVTFNTVARIKRDFVFDGTGNIAVKK